MIIEEMTQRQCREFLAKATLGRLACTRGEVPYIVPIYFAYEPDHLYGFSTLGQKIEWMRSNPSVCVEIDEIANHFRWTSVVLNGVYKELSDSPEYYAEREQARVLLERRFLWWQTAYAALQLRRKEPATTVFYSIRIENMTGREARPDGVESRLKLEDDRESQSNSARLQEGMKRDTTTAPA